MASIKLTGDTSGEITISAPAVAGTNTLTLPANTGNIITDDGTGKIDASGGGIYLGGTASANLLDDYEYGTYTPVFKEGTNSLSFGGGGHYVKNGNMVFVNCNIQNIVTSGSGTITCTLPFVSNGQATGTIMLSRFTNPANATYCTVFLLSGNDYVTPHWTYNNNQNASPMLVSQITSSGASDLYFSITYETV